MAVSPVHLEHAARAWTLVVDRASPLEHVERAAPWPDLVRSHPSPAVGIDEREVGRNGVIRSDRNVIAATRAAVVAEWVVVVHAALTIASPQ